MAPVDPLGQTATDAASLRELASDSSDYVRCWSALVASETRLAQVSIVRLVFAALVLPALALVVFVSTDALLACILERLTADWSTSIGITVVVNLCCLYGLIVAMRAWLRNLSLPRSRRALTRLMERMA